MYKLFSHEISYSKNGKMIQAEQQGYPQKLASYPFGISWNIHTGTPIPHQLRSDEPFVFFTPHDLLHPDNYATSTSFPLYSDKLINIFQNFGVRFEVFDAELYDVRSSKLISKKYKVFNLLESHHCIDEAKSTYKSDGIPILKEFRSIELLNEFKEKAIPLVRSKNHLEYVFIHDSLSQELQKRNILGCRFDPITNRKFLW